jgi:hypothetical protein
VSTSSNHGRGRERAAAAARTTTFGRQLADLERRVALVRPPPAATEGEGALAWIAHLTDQELTEAERIAFEAALAGRDLTEQKQLRLMAFEARALGRMIER